MEGQIEHQQTHQSRSHPDAGFCVTLPLSKILGVTGGVRAREWSPQYAEFPAYKAIRYARCFVCTRNSNLLFIVDVRCVFVATGSFLQLQAAGGVWRLRCPAFVAVCSFESLYYRCTEE